MSEQVVPVAYSTKRGRALGSAGRLGVFAVAVVALCIGIAILAAAEGTDFHPWSGTETTDDAYIRADQITLSSHVAGYVEAVPVRDNQRVDAGQVVAVIHDADYKARLEGAEAELKSAWSATTILEAQLPMQRSRIAGAEAAIRATKADLTQATLERSRQQTLVSNSYSPQRNLEAADAAAIRLTAILDQRTADALAAKQALDVIKQQIEQARQTIAAKTAARDLARIELGYTRIESPVSGQLSARSILAGEYVVAGSKIGTVVALPQVWVVANFRESQMARMQIGQEAWFTVDSVPGKTFRGKVESFEPLSGALQALLPPDNATGNFTKVAQRFAVKLTLIGEQIGIDRLRPGMSVVATVRTSGSPFAEAARR